MLWCNAAAGPHGRPPHAASRASCAAAAGQRCVLTEHEAQNRPSPPPDRPLPRFASPTLQQHAAALRRVTARRSLTPCNSTQRFFIQKSYTEHFPAAPRPSRSCSMVCSVSAISAVRAVTASPALVQWFSFGPRALCAAHLAPAASRRALAAKYGPDSITRLPSRACGIFRVAKIKSVGTAKPAGPIILVGPLWCLAGAARRTWSSWTGARTRRSGPPSRPG